MGTTKVLCFSFFSSPCSQFLVISTHASRVLPTVSGCPQLRALHFATGRDAVKTVNKWLTSTVNLDFSPDCKSTYSGAITGQWPTGTVA